MADVEARSMIRTYRYPLYPTKAQRAVLVSWLETCRQLYNAALQERREAWRMQKKAVTLFQQGKELTALRHAEPDIAQIPVLVERSALQRVDFAFLSFFKRCHRKEAPGYPRFRAAGRYDSFSVPDGKGNFRIDGDRLTLPKFTPIRFHRYRDLVGHIKKVTVRRTAKGWTVLFACDIGPAPEKAAVRASTGIDLGLVSFAVLSNGEQIDNPKFLKRGERLIADRQRALVRKKKGSSGRQQAKRRLAVAYEHTKNQRLDFARKLTAGLISRYDLIAYENLDIAHMVQTRFGKSIHDAGWGVFLRCLVSKAEEAGKWAIAVNPFGTTSRCSRCGEHVPKPIEERMHRCPRCLLELSRDHNAALNILALGASAVDLAIAQQRAAPV